MKFHLFIYATLGRRHELEAGMAGKRPELYQRMLGEVAEYVSFADEAGYAGFSHPEHHLQIEGFEASNEPGLLSMWIGQHSKRLRVNMIGWVAPTHNPVRTAEYIATLDHMLKGRLGVGLVRGYQARWVHKFRIRPVLNAVGDWNRYSPDDELNREYFTEFVELVL
jgi:alkanesulfonate monooxygenase SsuD/methylene tetrahydromethanopterin reductase-like flavin-dependent oxidoreductase (luciferase family)